MEDRQTNRDKQLIEDLQRFVDEIQLQKSKLELKKEVKNFKEFEKNPLVKNIEKKIEDNVLYRLSYRSPDNTDLPVAIQNQILETLNPVFGSHQRIKKWLATFSFKLKHIREYINQQIGKAIPFEKDYQLLALIEGMQNNGDDGEGAVSFLFKEGLDPLTYIPEL